MYGEWALAIPLAVRRDDSLVPIALFCEDVLQQFGSGLGGPILRNRLWFFCGLRAANPEQSDSGHQSGFDRELNEPGFVSE